MGEATAISWTDHTFNPWIGCTHAPNPDGTTAPECDNCYAEATDHRFFEGSHWGPNAGRRTLSDAYWRKPIAWNKKAAEAGVRRGVFCASQSDVFERRTGDIGLLLDALRLRLFDLIEDTPNLDWLLLTKRPDNAATMLPWCKDGTHDPWSNVWLGTSCGHPSSMWRVETLRQIPAAVRFVSCEPMLADFTRKQWDVMLGFRHPDHHGHIGSIVTDKNNEPSRVNWLIVGDESGHGRRPAQADWVRGAREAALRHGVAFHLKQWNSPPNAGIHSADPTSKGKIHLPILDGRQWAEFPK